MIDAGLLVGDREVLGLVFRELLKDEYQTGVIVDGFSSYQSTGRVSKAISRKTGPPSCALSRN